MPTFSDALAGLNPSKPPPIHFTPRGIIIGGTLKSGTQDQYEGGSLVDDATFKRMLDQWKTDGTISGDQFTQLSNFASAPGHSSNIDYDPEKGFMNRTTGQPANPATGGPDTAVAPAPQTSTSSGAPGGYAGSYGSPIGGGGGGGGGAAPAGVPSWAGGNGSSPSLSVSIPGGSGLGPGGTPFDPKAPLGLDPSKFSGSPVGGNPDFRSNTFPSAGDPFAGIGPNSSAQDIALALAKKQFANQQASLGIYGGLYDKYQSDPTLAGARGLAAQLAADPFSLSDSTVSRIAGRGIDAIGQRAGRLSQAAADRSAASGVSRGGAAGDEQYRVATNAANQAGGLERNLAIEQATRRPGELASAIGTVGQFGLNDAAGRNALGTGVADRVLGQTSILGDALLAGPLLAGGKAGNVSFNASGQSPVNQDFYGPFN
jgi:hypothetical protein